MDNNTSKTILLFEPWHFGDLIVAVEIAKHLKTANYKVALAYNPKWDNWIRTETFIDYYLPVSIPWTSRFFKQKYKISSYGLSFFKQNIIKLRSLEPDIVVDVRCDLRHRLFLKTVYPFKNVISLLHESKINVYRKKEFLLSKLKIKSVQDTTLNESINFPPQVVLFYGANDFNREIPIDKVQEIICSIKNLEICISILLRPEDNKDVWDKFLLAEDINNVYLIKGDLIQVSNIIKSSDIMISTDSGWLHLASLYGKKTIGLYGFDTLKSWLPPNTIALKSDVFLSAKYKYKKSHQMIQPLSSLDIDVVKKTLVNVIKNMKVNK
ncbi:MAG: hypothetical protein J0I09_08415 [Sphingobacteriia bacterium]|nr:hypothetical protein [Sphingobacteriia bacterium]